MHWVLCVSSRLLLLLLLDKFQDVALGEPSQYPRLISLSSDTLVILAPPWLSLNQE